MIKLIHQNVNFRERRANYSAIIYLLDVLIGPHCPTDFLEPTTLHGLHFLELSGD